jgi:hypothetical protein
MQRSAVRLVKLFEMEETNATKSVEWADYVDAFDAIPNPDRLAGEEWQRHEILLHLLARLDSYWAKSNKGVWCYSGIELRYVDYDCLVLAFWEAPLGDQVRRPGWCERLERLLKARFSQPIRVILEQ